MRFSLAHTHAAAQCGVAFAAWRGFDSSLRHESTLATCANQVGDAEHLLLWTVEARDANEALGLLPPWVAERTEARQVSEVPIP